MMTQYAQQFSTQYGYVPPPSPPMEENAKCSLPSISNLLGLADQGSPTSETSPACSSKSTKPETRPDSSHHVSSVPVRMTLPPSPPMSSETPAEDFNSPMTKPVSQPPGASNYYFEATPPLGSAEPEAQPMATMSRIPVQMPPGYQASFAVPAYMGQPGVSSYYSPMQPASLPAPPGSALGPFSVLYLQRPLPQTFPPTPVSLGMSPSSGTNPWQHHHYISPSSTASFPQTQDRYICPTCSKAFSRPSSLRIHSHSHTGEKPFKCPHTGCGKAFSVRSNMKRHERGCHPHVRAQSPVTASGSSLQALVL